jgi:uncharacterized membrane protein YukC
MSRMHGRDTEPVLPKSSSSDEISNESIVTDYPKETTSSEHELRILLAKKETKAIRYLKCFVIGVMVVAANAMSYVTYLLISKTEHDLFMSSFQNDANRLKLAYYEVATQRISVGAAFIIRYLIQATLNRQNPIHTRLLGTFNIIFLFFTVFQTN